MKRKFVFYTVVILFFFLIYNFLPDKTVAENMNAANQPALLDTGLIINSWEWQIIDSTDIGKVFTCNVYKKNDENEPSTSFDVYTFLLDGNYQTKHIADVEEKMERKKRPVCGMLSRVKVENTWHLKGRMLHLYNSSYINGIVPVNGKTSGKAEDHEYEIIDLSTRSITIKLISFQQHEVLINRKTN